MVNPMDKFTEKLPQYLEDGLTEAETIELEAHLADCAVCQAEFDALTRFDRLLASAPMAAPAPNFVAVFETKLERRLNRRRTLLGVLVIGSLLTAFSAVLAWGVFVSGAELWQWLSAGSLWRVGFDIFNGLVVVGITIGKIAAITFDALAKLMRHPALWGYVSVGVGLVWLWVQLFRWTNFARQPVAVRSQPSA